jgi:uncharacterized protein YbgA (DUF1722 family)
MRPDRKDLLDQVDFVWRLELADDYVKNWQQQYEKLVEFKRKNGHCLVPASYVQDKSLGRWVLSQRLSHVNNRMRPDRKDLLDELDFVWRAEIADNLDKQWRQQYEKLVEFKRKNGHCIVPYHYKQDKSLGSWVAKQRWFHTKTKMRQDRKDLLDEVEFVWKARACTSDDVRSFVIGSFHAWVRSFFSRSFCLCLISVGFGVGSVHQQCGSPKRSTRSNGVSTRSR